MASTPQSSVNTVIAQIYKGAASLFLTMLNTLIAWVASQGNAWDATVSYSIDDKVSVGGELFRSKINANLNNAPTAHATDANWQLLTANAVKVSAVAGGVFTGHNLAGACTLASAAIGDTRVMVFSVDLVGGAYVIVNHTTAFEATITVAGQIQQTGAVDLSTTSLVAVLQRSA